MSRKRGPITHISSPLLRGSSDRDLLRRGKTTVLTTTATTMEAERNSPSPASVTKSRPTMSRPTMLRHDSVPPTAPRRTEAGPGTHGEAPGRANSRRTNREAEPTTTALSAVVSPGPSVRSKQLRPLRVRKPSACVSVLEGGGTTNGRGGRPAGSQKTSGPGVDLRTGPEAGGVCPQKNYMANHGRCVIKEVMRKRQTE